MKDRLFLWARSMWARYRKCLFFSSLVKLGKTAGNREKIKKALKKAFKKGERMV